MDVKESKYKFLGQIANNEKWLAKYPALGNSEQAIQALRSACRSGKLPANKAELDGVDSWQVNPYSKGFKDWYNAYKSQPKVISKLSKAKVSQKPVIEGFGRDKKLKAKRDLLNEVAESKDNAS